MSGDGSDVAQETSNRQFHQACAADRTTTESDSPLLQTKELMLNSEVRLCEVQSFHVTNMRVFCIYRSEGHWTAETNIFWIVGRSVTLSR